MKKGRPGLVLSNLNLSRARGRIDQHRAGCQPGQTPLVGSNYDHEALRCGMRLGQHGAADSRVADVQNAYDRLEIIECGPPVFLCTRADSSRRSPL